jgi:hypothetical protein
LTANINDINATMRLRVPTCPVVMPTSKLMSLASEQQRKRLAEYQKPLMVESNLL